MYASPSHSGTPLFVEVMGRLDHLVEAVYERFKDRYFPGESASRITLFAIRRVVKLTLVFAHIEILVDLSGVKYVSYTLVCTSRLT